ncbi:tRNA-dihydrouridine synthase, partial [Microbacterium sp. 77mftsu3.1]|uniref:tRNA-dihydrouridine synthase n=1 Tax=Microbacterium sp. 77mftsu3.1 TaxID=1761802 RepID=UPI000889BC0B
DNDTEKRLPDDDCNNHGGSASWYFLPLLLNGQRTNVPAVGDTARGGTSTLPAGKTAKGGFTSKGATVSKGGFGGSGSYGGFGG